MSKSKKNVTKLLFSVIITTILLLAGSCQNWMSSDDFMSKIEREVHDANATEVNVYVRYANQTMGTTEPSGNTKMKVDVASKISAITNDDYGFVKWAAFTTKDFPTGKQHSSLIFVTEADYNENYKKKELPDTLVHFDNPTSPTTEVKIFTSQNDIFIIPIVAERPGKKGSFPKDTSENNVKNTSITVYFSKAIKEDSLKNSNEDSSEESGKNVNFSITSMSFNSYLAGDTSNIEEEDITDYFTYELDSSGTILTFTLKEGKLLGSNQTITVTLYEDICDRDGFKMKGNSIFTFDTGTQSDNLAPIIEVLLGGRGDTRLGDFVSFHNDDEIKGSATEAAEKAPKNINDEVYTSSLIAQRVSDKLYIYVKAVDIIGAGANAPETANTLKEENVRYIGVRASLYIENKDDKGVPLTKNREELVESIKKNNMLYIPDNIDEKTDTSGLFSELFQDIVPLEDKDKEDSAYNGGEIFSYDVSNLPDGLIKIDVWGMDKNNNSGDDFSKGAAYYKNHDNGYKSIFVVKDTTPPDSAKESSKIKSNSAQAPYYWYNNTTLKTMQLYDLDTNKITDNGHVKLRSLAENLSWNFVVGKVDQAPAADHKGWKLIHDQETGASLKYDLGSAQPPAKDGPVDITMFIRDDLGNVSEPVLLKSIMYDNTQPEVKLNSGRGDFVKANGEADLHVSEPEVIEQILKVNITEANENNTGSGIHRLEIHVAKDGQEVALPLDETKFKVKYAPATVANPKPETATEIGIVPVGTDPSMADLDENKIKVFEVTDANKITSGTLFIYGITLGKDDGIYKVSVDLYDSALNKTPATAETIMARDTTNPVISKVQVMDVISRKVYGADEETWWLPYNLFESANSLSKVTLKVTADESGSGLEYLKLADNAEFTENTKLYIGDKLLERNEDYELDTASRTIHLLDWYTPLLINEKNKTQLITLENIKLNNINSANNSKGNEIQLTVDDFVGKSKSNNKEIVYGNTSTKGTLVYADATPPVITDLKIEDSAQNGTTNPDNKAYDKANYTNSQTVTLLLTLAAESAHNGSGVKVIHLSDNAFFTGNTEIYVDNTLLPSGYTIAADNKSVTFEKVFTAANVIKFTNVQIASQTEGTQSVKADLTDFVGLDTVASKKSSDITFDSVNPVINTIEWKSGNSLTAIGNIQTNEVDDQTLEVDFTEATAGVKVIRFDIDYEGTGSYETPFDMNGFDFRYGTTPLLPTTDYTISDGRYILLNNPVTSGTFNFTNFKLANQSLEGQYNIKITLLDAAENKNPQATGSVFKKSIFMDTTAPVVSKVQVMDVMPRTVYGDASAAKTWWLPYSLFDENKSLSKVSFQIKAEEAGSGLKYIKLSEDIEFTAATKLKKGDKYLAQGTDYILDTAAKTITLLNHETPELKGTNDAPSTEFTLENIKFNKINDASGNKVGFRVDDFVDNIGTNKIVNTENYTVYYDDTTTGNLIYADSTPPVISAIKIEDAAQDSTANPDNKAYDNAHYTNSQNITLTITLAPESTNNGSGVKTIKLTNNAKFTDSTTIKIDGTLLSAGKYTIAADKKSVDFEDVFTAANVITFTDVQIVSTTPGQQKVKADLTDFVGINTVESKETEIPLVLDLTKPAVTSIKWMADDSTVTAGSANEKTILNQNLRVVFNEETAGVKVLKMDIIHDGITTIPYTLPFASADFKLLDENGEELVKGSDYTIDGQYIILTTPRKSGTLNFRGITLKNTKEEGLYTINVALLDAAENRIDTDTYTNSQNHKPNIVIDTVKPEITQNLYIPKIYETTELTTGTSSLDGKWLDKTYVGGDGTGKAPDAIPVYITVKEKSSGVKVIKFAESAVLSDSTTLWTVAADGTETEVTPKASRYEVVPKTKEIIIKSELDAKQLFARQDESDFKILVKNVGFENADSATEASINTISLSVSDVAKNPSDSKTTLEARILSDSISPAAPTGLTLKDRAHSTANKTIEASAGYTNESIVDMTFNLTASEQYGSGYHKFVLNGASFIGGDTADKTTMTIKAGNTVITDAEFALSDDGKTLTLKKTGQAADVYAVIRQAVSVELKNVQLDNATTNGLHTVTLKAYDLTGWDSTAASTSITLDTEKPALEKGVFAANYTNSSAAYYQPSINVYPHASGESATGVSINYGTETYQKDIPTFYTATTYKTSGYYQYKGQVSSSSSSVNTNFDHGAVLGIRAKDNIKLGGWTRAKTFLYYYKYTTSDTLFSKTEADILGSTNPELDINNKGNNNNPPNGNNTETGTTLWFGFDEGKYSAVIVDEAGNCSNVFHFAVVRDVDQPKKSTITGNANNLNERVLLQKPDASANIFTNSAVSIIRTSGGFPRFWGCGSDQDTMSANSSMKTKKYVTKKSSNKYKIQLNLGGTVSNSTLSSKINGGAASDVTPYSDLTPTDTSSPIEMYAVSTLYGSWPDEDHPSYKYCPVVPSGTSFPSGQTYSNSSSICKDYFAYTNGFSDSWYIYNSSSANWHPYKTSTSSNTDSYSYPYSYSSLSVSITSYVDSNNNLIIEIPNTKSTVPISVFLKDGCGNMEYVVCGLYKENGYDVAISFVIDDKLGSAPTSDGIVTTPFIIQFPYSYYDSEGTDVPWGGYNFHAGTQAGNSEAPSSQYGTGAKRGFVKDFVKHATYYNPALSNSTEALQIKHGFALHFFPNGVDRDVASNITGKEDITFDDTDWSDTEKAKGIRKASATDITKGDYTCRALMYCTNSSDTPTYAQIKACYDTEMAKEAANRTGQVTDWSYVQVSSSAIEAILFVDYPKPNYTKLNWDVNEDNGEPKPFYMWYIFEDAVGNYELAKVVNDATSGNYLKTTNSSHFDKWLYDAEAPKLTIRGTSIDPSTITAANISQLVPTNNGFVPYVNGNNIYVHASKTHTSVQSGGSLNNPTSLGITQTADNSEGNYSKYNSFVDLEVSERTGVRMYAWTTSANSTFDYPTSSTYYGWRDYWLTKSDPYWYVGYGGISPVDKDIGNGSYSYDGCPQSAYYYGNTNTAYTGVYAGVKICTTIPYGKLSTSTATELWLHVMDWTGNIKHYRMGASGVKFINDSTAPDYTSTAVTGTVVPDQYYIEKGTGTPTVRIAGNGSYANTTDKKDIKLYIPTSYFTETGSGIKGFSFNGDGTGIAAADDGGLYLTLTYNQYHYTDTNPHSLNYYIYDNVGNRKQLSLNIIYDNIAPKIKNIALVIKGSTNKINKIADTENGLISNDTVEHPEWGFDCYNNYAAKPKNGESTGYTQYQASLNDVPTEVIQNIYINNSNVTKLHINIDNTVDHSDIVDVIVNKWNGSAWEEKSSVAKWIANPDSSTVPKWFYEEDKLLTTTNIFHMGSGNTDGYDTLEYSRAGTYYQIVAQDISGNTCCQYFKLILDDEAPALTKDSSNQTIKPQITLGKGSINNVGSTYYYTADTDNPLTLKFGIVDAGSGSKEKLKKFKYSLNGTDFFPEDEKDDEDKVIAKHYIDDPSEIEIEIASGDIETIYFMDILGNVTDLSAATPFFTYAYTNAAGTSDTVTIRKLTYYTTVSANYNADGTPKAPSLTQGTLAKSGKTYPVVEEISTYGVGYNDSVNYSNTAVYTKYYTQLLSEGVILIKSKERDKLKITLPMPEGIIGYLVTDENGNPVKVTKYTTTTNEDGIEVTTQEIVTGSVLNDERHPGKDSYSFTTSLKHEFEETLPMILPSGLNGNYEIAKRKYWAVDVVGNISSTPLTLQYSYSDPNMAKNITLIQSIDQVTEADVKEQMQADINAHTLSFANFALKAGTKIAGNRDNKKGKVYFNNDFIVLRCDLNGKADTFAEAPALVELYDVWDGGKGMRGTSIDIRDQTGDYSDKFRVYPSNTTTIGENGETRYYCYIAFKLDKDTLNKNNKIFDNNDTYGGGVIHAKIYGKGQAESDIEYLTVKVDNKTVTKAMNYGWWLDTAGPVINNSDYYFSGDNVNKLKGYLIAENNTLLDGFSKAKDNSNGLNYETNIYNNSTRISYLINKDANTPNFKDVLTSVAKYIFVTSTGFAAAKPAAYATGWTPLDVSANNTDYYDFNLPVINEPHKHVALFLMDAVGNISEPYYLVDKTTTSIAWWLTDHGPQNVSITEDGTTESLAFVPGTNQYVLNVAMDPGAVIKSITADNATIAGVEFNDYSHGQPTYKKSTGKFSNNESWINISSIKVTITVQQTWSEQPVKLYINGTGDANKYDVFTIPARTLGADNITINEGENSKTWTSGTANYELPIAFTDGAGIGNVSSIEIGTGEGAATGVTAEWTSGATTVTIKGVPGQAWSTQKVYLKINGSITKEVFTIPAKKLGTDNIILTPVDWVSGTNSYDVPVELKDGETSLDIGLLDGMTFSAGIEGSNVILDKDNSKFSMTGISITQGWQAQTVKITISGANVSDSVEKVAVNVAAKKLGADNITINEGENSKTWTSGTANYELPIAFTDGAGIANVSSIEIGTGEGAATGVTAEWTSGATTVTIKGVPGQTWSTQKVYLKINGTIIKEVFAIPAKKLGVDNIILTPVDWVSGTNSYDVPVELKDGETALDIGLLDGMTFSAGIEGSNVTLDKDNSKFSMTGISVTQGWEAQTVKITISGANVSDSVEKVAVNVAALSLGEGNISINGGETPVTWTSGTANYELPIAFTDGAGIGNVSSIEIGTGEGAATGVTAEWTSGATTVTIEGVPGQIWSAQKVYLKINDTFTKEVFTIPAKKLGAEHIILTPVDWVSGTTSYQVPVVLKDGETSLDIGLLDGMTFSAGIENSQVTLDKENSKLSLTGISVTQTWGTQIIDVSISGNNVSGTVTKTAINVAAKTYDSSCITITPFDQGPDKVTDWGKTEVTIQVASERTITDIASKYPAKFTATKDGNPWDEGGKSKTNVKLKLVEGATVTNADIVIKVTTADGSADQGVYVRIDEQENRYFGRALSLKGLSEVYTFADTPSSVAAMQTRIIELPAVVQKAWETFTEEKEEVAAALAPASQVVEPKKSSKKANKKAAKKVVEAVTETAAALEVTELPVEALEEAKVDDQLAMILPQTANTEEAELVEPQASVSAGAVDVSVTEAEPASEKHSSAAIWVVLLAVLSSVAGLIFLKKRKVSV